MKKDIVVKSLKEISNKLNEVSDKEISKWLSGELSLQIKFVPRENKNKKESPEKKRDELEKILNNLQNLKTREEGSLFLESTFPNKTALENFARFIDVPVVRKDKVSQLREKIVEATIGAIIRSKAIQGEDVKA